MSRMKSGSKALVWCAWPGLRQLWLRGSYPALALAIGIVGYHSLGKLDWVDSLLEASMILGGMGPVNQLSKDGVKVFASLYALFSGLVFVGVIGIVFAPVAHRFLHKFHVDEGDEGGD